MTDDAAAQFAALLGHTTPQPTEDTTPTEDTSGWGNGRRPPRPDRSQASGGNQPEVVDPAHAFAQAIARHQSGGMWRDL